MKAEGGRMNKTTNSPLTNSPRLVIFDLGRVLVRICDSWKHACTLAGIADQITWRDLDTAEQAQITPIIHDFDTGQIDLHTFAQRAGPLRGLSIEQMIAMNNAYLLGPFPGAAELLDDLNIAGHITACLSNTNPNHWKRLTNPADPHGQLLARLRHRFGSHLMQVRKPNPEIYARVERETNTPAEQIIFFDDLPENIAAARERGWTAHLVEIVENPIPAIRAHLQYEGVLK
jgi:HAD superfamily hydrolase (TIGR01509 family)